MGVSLRSTSCTAPGLGEQHISGSHAVLCDKVSAGTAPSCTPRQPTVTPGSPPPVTHIPFRDPWIIPSRDPWITPPQLRRRGRDGWVAWRRRRGRDGAERVAAGRTKNVRNAAQSAAVMADGIGARSVRWSVPVWRSYCGQIQSPLGSELQSRAGWACRSSSERRTILHPPPPHVTPPQVIYNSAAVAVAHARGTVYRRRYRAVAKWSAVCSQ